MSNDTVRTLSCGQGVEIQDACRRQNVTLAELKLLTSGNNLRRSIDFLNGIEEKVGGSSPFDPAAFIGKGWEIIENRESLPENWDPSKTTLESSLKPGEQYVTGEEAIKRLANKPLLGAQAFHFYWNNKHLIPSEWKGKYVFFDATVLQGPHGHRYSLCLCWDDGDWYWRYHWLGDDRRADDVSASLAS